MGLLQRMRTVIVANLNDLTERCEDPEKMLKQAIREMEEAIADATQETAKVMATKKLLARELARNEQQSQLWHGRAQQAVQAGDDDLARSALGRQHEHDKLLTALEDQARAAEDTARSLQSQLGGMRVKLEQARRSLATLSARHKAATFRKKMETESLDPASAAAEAAFARFDRLREKVERAEAEADALTELRAAGGKENLPEFESEEDDAEIEAQLQALKQKRAE